MAITRSSTAASTPKPANTGFRLDDKDVSDSDSDQSAHGSVRSVSPSKKGTKATRSKKRRVLKSERKQVGQLTDELDTLLGAAFVAPAEDVANESIAPIQSEQTMDVEIPSVEKRLPKRTRQNMAKMEKRRREREQKMNGVRDVPMPTHDQQRQNQTQSKTGNGVTNGNQTKKNATLARRARKEKQRARVRAEAGDAMEIG